MTSSPEGEGGDRPKDDEWWRGGGGVTISPKNDDVIYEQPLMEGCCCRSTRWWIWMDIGWTGSDSPLDTYSLDAHHLSYYNTSPGKIDPRHSRETVDKKKPGAPIHPPTHMGSGHYFYLRGQGGKLNPPPKQVALSPLVGHTHMVQCSWAQHEA